MANVQIPIGGAAVALTGLVNGSGGLPAPGSPQFEIYAADRTTVIVPATTFNNAAGASITVNGFTFTVVSPAGGGNGTYSLQAGSTVAALSGAILALSNVTDGRYTTLDVTAAAPATPSGVTATAGPNLAVTFNGTNAGSQPSGTTYNLLRATTAGGEGTSPVASGYTALPFTYTEAAPGTYYYKLTATSGGTTSAASAEVSTTAYNAASQPSNTAGGTPTVPAPGAVTGLTLALADDGTKPNPTLIWTLPTSGQAVTGINIMRGPTTGGESATPLNASPLSASATSFVDSTAAYNTTYYYFVQTIDAGGYTNSAEVHIKTDTSAPTNLTATPGNNVITLAWTNATGALATLIETSSNGTTGWAALVIVGAGIATYADTTAVNGTQKFYRVRDLD